MSSRSTQRGPLLHHDYFFLKGQRCLNRPLKDATEDKKFFYEIQFSITRISTYKFGRNLVGVKHTDKSFI